MKYFTIGVIVEIGKKKITISDLQNIKVDVYTDDIYRFSKHDVIAITNAEVGHAITIKKPNQIIKIGTNAQVVKCKKADYSDPNCCIWVDERKGIMCAHHCAEGYVAASKARMVLRQSVPVKAPEHDTNKLIKADLSKTGAEDKKEAQIYLETHPNSRSAQIARKLKEPDTSSIAKGFKSGDMINLDF